MCTSGKTSEAKLAGFVPSLAWWATRVVAAHMSCKQCSIADGVATSNEYVKNRVNNALVGMDSLKWVEVAVKTEAYDIEVELAIDAYLLRNIETRRIGTVKRRKSVEFIIDGVLIRTELLTVDLGGCERPRLLCGGNLLVISCATALECMKVSLDYVPIAYGESTVGYTTSDIEVSVETHVRDALIENGMLRKIWVPPECILAQYTAGRGAMWMRCVECEYSDIETTVPQTRIVLKESGGVRMERVW